MSVLERNEPRITGHPGFTSWVRAMPVKASASCWASVAGMETGDIAPISRNGVTITGWRARLYSNIEASMRSSKRSGELTLISETTPGVFSIASRPPNRISVMRMVSAAFGPEVTEPM